MLAVPFNVTGQSARMAAMADEQNSVDMSEDKEPQ